MKKLFKEKLWSKAKKKILGGNLLLSKRPEMFLPDYWPTYFKKAKGIYVWDLKNNKYTDMIFAVGQSTLGYSNDKIDKEVSRYIKKGNMTTLNCPEEVKLAEKLIKIHKWAGLVKFARSGGEANAISIRIARAAARNDRIAICGYHGWHDWYLSVNLKSNNALKNHLLPGLDPVGVPKSLKNQVYTFDKNNIDKIKSIHKKHDIGIVKLEIARSELPDKKFLSELKTFCKKEKIILVFDECTSGFRRNLGGIHLTTGVNPDIAMLGKAIGNGYAITAIIGKKKIMKLAESSFISSTFWTERIGFIEAIKTIEIMEKTESYKKLIKNGKYLNSCWKKIAKKYNLKIEISGIESITSFQFNKNNRLYKTYISQEMLKKGYLASNLVYLSTLHTKQVIDKYIKCLDEVFRNISSHQKNRKKKLLISKLSHNTFKRLTN